MSPTRPTPSRTPWSPTSGSASRAAVVGTTPTPARGMETVGWSGSLVSNWTLVDRAPRVVAAKDSVSVVESRRAMASLPKPAVKARSPTCRLEMVSVVRPGLRTRSVTDAVLSRLTSPKSTESVATEILAMARASTIHVVLVVLVPSDRLATTVSAEVVSATCRKLLAADSWTPSTSHWRVSRSSSSSWLSTSNCTLWPGSIRTRVSTGVRDTITGGSLTSSTCS